MPRNLITATVAFGLCMIWSHSSSAAATLVSQNLGPSAYSASAFWEPGTEPDKAFDGSLDSNWNAGNYPTQWLDVELQQPRDVTSFKLNVNQLPDAETIHEVWVSNSAIQGELSGAMLVHAFVGFTADQDILSYTLLSPVSAQFVQVRTTDSPTWVAWNEVQVFAEVPEPATSSLMLLSAAGLCFRRREASQKAPATHQRVKLANNPPKTLLAGVLKTHMVDNAASAFRELMGG
jgi:F5/8 type C domain/PEP-CTERM motif